MCIIAYRITSLDMLPDTFTHPLVGPALTIRNHLLKWEGAPSGETSSELVHFRVLFEAGIEEVTSCLDMQNSGTTAIYYSWKVIQYTYTSIIIHL